MINDIQSGSILFDGESSRYFADTN
jgi:hypothetical protein